MSTNSYRQQTAFPCQGSTRLAPTRLGMGACAVPVSKIWFEILRLRLDHKGVTRSEYELSSFTTATNPFNRREILTLKARPAVQTTFQAILRALRERHLALFVIDAYIYRITDPQGPIPELLRDQELGQRDSVIVLDDLTMEVFQKDLGRLERRRDSNVKAVDVPSLTLLESQRGHMLVVNEQAYVADYRVVEVIGRKRTVVDPVIKQLETGMGLDLRVVQLDEAFCRLECAYHHAELRQPIETRATRHGEVQTPVIDTIRVRLNPNVALGAWTLITTRKQPSLGIDLIFIRVKPSKLTKNRAKVIGAGPLAGAIETVFVDVAKAKGLELGQAVRLYAASPEQTALGQGMVTHIGRDVATVSLDPALKRPVPSALWCAW